MSKIEWTNKTWNPVTGCTKISSGCKNCYAERMARRLAGRAGYPEAPDHFDVTLRPDRLGQPLRWKQPLMIFVCSMGDLFHEDVPPSFIFRVFNIIALNPRHTFQILTKRTERMMTILDFYYNTYTNDIPFSNVWLMTTVENQAAADLRLPWLINTPAVVRGVSCEPLLEKVNLHSGLGYIDWVIAGGETGPGARQIKPQAVYGLRVKCHLWHIPFFFKSWGGVSKKNGWVIDGETYQGNKLDGLTHEAYPRAVAND